MATLPVFLLLSEAARKSRQFAAQMGVEVSMQGTEFLKNISGQSGPEKEKGKINIDGDGVEPFGELLTKRIGFLALPPEPQDEPDAIILPILPQGIIGWNGEMAKEKVAIQQQIADGGKSQGQAELGGGGVGMSDQVCGIDAAAVGRVEIPCASEPFGKLRGTFGEQFQPEMSGDVEVVSQVKAGNVA